MVGGESEMGAVSTEEDALVEERSAPDDEDTVDDGLEEMVGEGRFGEGLPFPLGEGRLTEGTAWEGLGAARFDGDPTVGAALPLLELGSAALLTLLVVDNDTGTQDFLPRIALWNVACCFFSDLSNVWWPFSSLGSA